MLWGQTLPASLRPGELRGPPSSIRSLTPAQSFLSVPQGAGEECIDAPEITGNTSLDRRIWVYWYLLQPRRPHPVEDCGESQ